MSEERLSPIDRKRLEERVSEYFAATLERDFHRAVAVLYPGDLDKFRIGVLWCARAMAPYGETRQFLDLFGNDMEIEDIEVLDPPKFLQRFLEGMSGTQPASEWEKILKSLKLRQIRQTGNDTAEVVYAYDPAPWDGDPSLVDQSMVFQRVGDQWYGLIDRNLRQATERIRRDIVDFERRGRLDVDPKERTGWTLEPFALHGFRNMETGEIALEPRFAEAEEFSQGLAAVRFFRKWGFINPAGEVVIQPQYERADSFSDGLAAVALESDVFDLKWGYINRDGKFVCECQFDNAGRFSDGLAAVEKDELWGYIDERGDLVIDYKFESAGPFEDGRAEVTTDTEDGFEYFTIDQNGEVIEGDIPF